MVDRLRALLDRPLDPRAGRAIVVLATAISLGFATLIVLAGSAEQSSRSASVVDRGHLRQPIASPSGSGVVSVEAPPAPSRDARRRQDPQDDLQSTAGRRAESALRRHRALQHVPYRQGRLQIRLVGARRGRAILRVTAPSFSSAHDGWRGFLSRYGDSGNGYLPRFRVDGRHGPSATGREG